MNRGLQLPKNDNFFVDSLDATPNNIMTKLALSTEPGRPRESILNISNKINAFLYWNQRRK
jgi:hypothetical protein